MLGATRYWMVLCWVVLVIGAWPNPSPRLDPIVFHEPWTPVAESCMPPLSIAGVLAKPGPGQRDTVALRHWGSTPLALQGMVLRMGKRRHRLERSQITLGGELLLVEVKGLRDQGGEVWLEDACGLRVASFSWKAAARGQWQWSPLEQAHPLRAELAYR